MAARLGRRLLRPAAVVAFGYLVLLGLLYFQQESLLFFPRPESNEAGRWSDYRVEFERDGVTLRGWFIPSETATHVIVYFGGNGDELSRAIERVRQIGDFDFLLVNYRGYGSSEGAPGDAAIKADSAFILEQMVADGRLELAKTHVIGRSLGTGVATWLAARYEFASVVLISPYDSVADVAASLYPVFPVRSLIRHPFDSMTAAPEIEEPVLVIKAEHDAVVPHEHTDRLIEALPAEPAVFTLPGTTHNRVFTEALYERLDAFLGQFPSP